MAHKKEDDEIVLVEDEGDTSIIDEVDEPDSTLVADSSEEAAETKVEASVTPGSDGVLDPTRIYLSEIGASKLLTAEEEVYYARLAQKGDAAGRHPHHSGR